MNKSFIRSVYIFTVLLVTALLVSCGGGGGGGAGTGTLNLSLTDAASGDYKAVYVTINEVWVKHAEKDWEMLVFSDSEILLPQTINLLDYMNGFRARLGYDELEAGHYTQMRLILEDSGQAPQSSDANILGHPHPYYNYVIDAEDNEIFLKVPSGGQSGVKLVGGFDIENTKSTDIILDFDAHRSIHAHPAGKTGEWRLRPTIKVVEIINSVSGNVVRVVDQVDEALPGAEVSAQTYNTAAVDFKDEVVSVAGTFSDADGNYFMLLPKNITVSPYNIVAIKYEVVTENDVETTLVFGPKCQALDSTESNEYIDRNFTLAQAETTGNVSVSITGLPEPGAGENYSAYLSIRQFIDCDGDGDQDEIIEITFKQFTKTDAEDIECGSFTLPVGVYEIVAWADGEGTVNSPEFEIHEGDNPSLSINFSSP